MITFVGQSQLLLPRVGLGCGLDEGFVEPLQGVYIGIQIPPLIEAGLHPIKVGRGFYSLEMSGVLDNNGQLLTLLCKIQHFPEFSKYTTAIVGSLFKTPLAIATLTTASEHGSQSIITVLMFGESFMFL